MKNNIITLLLSCILAQCTYTMQQVSLKENEYADEPRASEYIKKAYNQLKKKQFIITCLWLKRALACEKISPELAARLQLLRANYFMSIEPDTARKMSAADQSNAAQEMLQSLQYAIEKTKDPEVRTCAELRLAAVYSDGLWGVTRDFEKVVTLLKPLVEKLSSTSALDKARKISINQTLAFVYEHGGFGIEKNEELALSYIFEAARLSPTI